MMFEMSKSKTILLNMYKYLNIENLHQVKNKVYLMVVL